MSSQKSSFPRTRSGPGARTSANGTGPNNLNRPINGNLAAARGRSSAIVNVNRNRLGNQAATPGRNVPVPRPRPVLMAPHESAEQCAPGGFGDYVPGMRPVFTPSSEALAREIEALREKGVNEPARGMQPQPQPRIVKRRNHSTYFRGPDATGFHIPSPCPENRLGDMMPLLLDEEAEEMDVNRKILEKTLPNTFYSTRMKYKDSLNTADKVFEEIEDSLGKFRLPSAGYHSAGIDNDTPSSRSPIDNPQFKLPKEATSSSSISPRTRNYNAVFGEDALSVADEGEIENENASTSDGSESGSSSEDDETGSASETEGSSTEGEEDSQNHKSQEKKLLKQTFMKEKQKFETLKAKENGKSASPNPNPKAVPAHKAASKPNIAGKGFLKDLHQHSSILGKNIDEIKKGLEALPTFINEPPKPPRRFAAPPPPELRPLKPIPKLQLDSLSPSSLSGHIKKTPVQSPKFNGTTGLRNQVPNIGAGTAKPSRPSESSPPKTDVIDKMEILREKVLKMVPPNHPNRKLLTGSTKLSASPSSTSIHARIGSRQRAPALSTRSGLTIVTTSGGGEDPMDEFLREHDTLRNAASHSASKARREVEKLKQKLGIAPGMKLNPSLDALSSTSGTGLEKPNSLFLNAQLKMPRTTKSSKLVRDQFQAKDAEMIAARRKAILAKVNQQRSKYLLTDEELKQRLQGNRPSRLTQPTQAFLQKIEPKPATYIPKQYKHLLTEQQDKVRLSRFGASGNTFKPSPTLQSIPKRAVPAWKSI